MLERHPGPRRAAALGVALLLIAAVGVAAPRLAHAAAEAPNLPGVDLSSLNDAQKAVAVKILESQHCDCSCGMTVADCRRRDQHCPRSPQIAAQVVQLLAAGKSEDDVVKTVFAAKPAAAAAPAGAGGAAPAEMVFDVPAGDSYSVGPADAPVTIVTWLDYQ